MIASLVVAVLASISFLHLSWAARGLPAGSWAVPSVPVGRDADGRARQVPAFKPTRAAALAVAAALAALALLVALRASWFGPAPMPLALRWVLLNAALVFTVRAIGDFKLVGFFQRPSDSDFARLDHWLYSPLCVALAAGLACVAFS